MKFYPPDEISDPKSDLKAEQEDSTQPSRAYNILKSMLNPLLDVLITEHEHSKGFDEFLRWHRWHHCN